MGGVFLVGFFGSPGRDAAFDEEDHSPVKRSDPALCAVLRHLGHCVCESHKAYTHWQQPHAWAIPLHLLVATLMRGGPWLLRPSCPFLSHETIMNYSAYKVRRMRSSSVSRGTGYEYVS